MSDENVVVRWYVDDGYVTGDRPMTTEIPVSDFEDAVTKEERDKLISEYVHEDFAERVSVEIKSVEWPK